MEYVEAVQSFIVTNFLLGDAGSLKEDSSFLEEGIIDSTGMLELILFLEETYDIKIEDDELVPENLDSLQRISVFLSRKVG